MPLPLAPAQSAGEGVSLIFEDLDLAYDCTENFLSPHKFMRGEDRGEGLPLKTRWIFEIHSPEVKHLKGEIWSLFSHRLGQRA